MPQEHIVKPGEHLAAIADAYGFTNWLAIWDAPENKSLKDLRKNPNVLLAGDKLTIPDRQTRDESGATEQKHTFKVSAPKLKLRIALHGLKDQPLSGHEGSLTIETDKEDFRTKSDGMIERDIAPNARKGTLVDSGPPPEPNQPRLDRTIELQIGFLDPVAEVSGQIQRLNNLGYQAGDTLDRVFTDAEAEEIRKSLRFRSAVEEFQCDFKLQIDGTCGPNTQNKLLEIHGS